MLQKSKIRKSWYASSGLTKEEWYQQAIAKQEERKKLNWNKWYEGEMNFECRKKAKEHQTETQNQIKELLYAYYRTAANAAHFDGIRKLTGRLAIWTDYTLDWNMYSKNYGHPGREYYTCIQTPVLFDLPPAQLRIFDNIVNLKCEFSNCKDNITIYSATWVKQLSGFNVALQEGFIAVNWKHNISFHADTAENAEKGLIRKVKKETAPPKKEKSYADWKLIDYITRKKFHELTGACMEGIEQFCHRTRIDDKTRRIQIKDLLPLLEKYAKVYYDKVAENAPQLFKEV